ncbi:hypothetical protein FACS1894103_7210 [Campylobacterota bacterium]|nr:hypothetical protein FACS1894103_7210 [Campylobacterota bacterium]
MTASRYQERLTPQALDIQGRQRTKFNDNNDNDYLSLEETIALFKRGGSNGEQNEGRRGYVSEDSLRHRHLARLGLAPNFTERESRENRRIAQLERLPESCLSEDEKALLAEKERKRNEELALLEQAKLEKQERRKAKAALAKITNASNKKPLTAEELEALRERRRRYKRTALDKMPEWKKQERRNTECMRSKARYRRLKAEAEAARAAAKTTGADQAR